MRPHQRTANDEPCCGSAWSTIRTRSTVRSRANKLTTTIKEHHDKELFHLVGGVEGRGHNRQVVGLVHLQGQHPMREVDVGLTLRYHFCWKALGLIYFFNPISMYVSAD